MRFSLKTLLLAVTLIAMSLTIVHQQYLIRRQQFAMKMVAKDIRSIVGNEMHLLDAEIVMWKRDPTTNIGWREIERIDTGYEVRLPQREAPEKVLYTLEERKVSQVRRGFLSLAHWLDGENRND